MGEFNCTYRRVIDIVFVVEVGGSFLGSGFELFLLGRRSFFSRGRAGFFSCVDLGDIGF